jgi:hypothetical protein
MTDRVLGPREPMPPVSGPPVAPGPRRADPGKYRKLTVYLEKRFADRVVLTFGEIEDLVGFPLPEPARVDGAWWEGPSATANKSEQAAAWVLADRSAIVNFQAGRVTFERV